MEICVERGFEDGRAEVASGTSKWYFGWIRFVYKGRWMKRRKRQA
jgi:hypothetical protein